MLVSPDVVDTIHERFVPTELYVDLPDKNPIEQVHADLLKELSKGRPSPIPVYVILTPDGKTVLARINGRTSEAEFTAFLEEGWKAWEATAKK